MFFRALLKPALWMCLSVQVGCVLPAVSAEGRPCPCATGWTCDQATERCVRCVGAACANGDAGERADARGDALDAWSNLDAPRDDAWGADAWSADAWSPDDADLDGGVDAFVSPDAAPMLLARTDPRIVTWFTAGEPLTSATSMRYLVDTQGTIASIATDTPADGAVHSVDGITHAMNGWRFLRVADEGAFASFGVTAGVREAGGAFFHQVATPVRWAGGGGDGSSRGASYSTFSETMTVGQSYWLVRSIEFLPSEFPPTRALSVGSITLRYASPPAYFPFDPPPVSWFWEEGGAQLGAYLRHAERDTTPSHFVGNTAGYTFPVARGVRYEIVERITMDRTAGRYAMWMRPGRDGALRQLADYTGPLGYFDPGDVASCTHYPSWGLFDYTLPFEGRYGMVSDGMIMLRDDAGPVTITPTLLMDTLVRE